MSERFNGFILIDAETTGLVAAKGFMLELGMAYYSPEFELQDVFQSLILDEPTLKFIESWDNNDDAWRMHDRSGLLADLDALGKPTNETSPAWVAQAATEWLNRCGVNKSNPVPWTGSSVHFDKEWTTHHMGTLASNFSYRTIDASSFREYARVAAPDVAAKIDAETKPRKEHRVMPDILDTVELFLALRKYGVMIS